jgi:Ca2+-transporting ATPase
MFILLIAAGLSFTIGEIKDTIVILIAVIINVILGFVQEFKAEKAARTLKSFEVPYCNVKRDGAIYSIPAKNLVPGDIVLLSAGSKVPADIQLTHIVDFQVEEALLTGESKPIKKKLVDIQDDVTVGDRINMAFSGANVLSGKAEGIVTATGASSYLGHIATLVITTKEKPTPLQTKIKRLGRWLGLVFSSVTLLIFILGLITGIPFYEIILISVSLAVAAIPEGLLVGVTVILAIGMQKMLKQKALVRHLIAAETLGSVSVICTDKTGTLTQGHMQVSKIIANGAKEDLILYSALNNDAQLHNSKKILGNPTEIALLQYAKQKKINIKKIREQYKRIDEIPFSSNLKYMATVHTFGTHELLIVKGAPEKIFALSENQNAIQIFKRNTKTMAKQGLRILAIAIKKAKKINLKKDLNQLTLVGILGIEDPLRPRAKKTVTELKQAGITLVLVTGDHKETASNIAEKVGISHKKENIITGTELDNITDTELKKKVDHINIFARVDPRHKIRIINAWQKKGKAVAMTGDGVNDAPSLKAADIGVALGSGSDVSHEVSDIVLLDNNLSIISHAVKQGRTIFDNIRKIIVYLMADSFTEIVLITGAILCGLPIPILASQILWINLVTDGFPYMALTIEPSEPHIMQEQPRPKQEHIINKEMKLLIFVIGIITDIGLFGLYYALLRLNFNLQHIRTIMFTAIAIDSLFYAFSVKSLKRSLLKINPFSNKWLVYAVIAGFLVQLSAIYLPFMQKLFSTITLNLLEWSIIICLALIKLVGIEVTKKCSNYFFLRKKITTKKMF